VVPVFFGVADQDWGANALEALLREAPDPETTAERRGITLMLVCPWLSAENLLHSSGGKLSLVRGLTS